MVLADVGKNRGNRWQRRTGGQASFWLRGVDPPSLPGRRVPLFRPELLRSEGRTSLTRLPLLFLMGMAVWGTASGQQAGFSGPVEGYTFDAPTASLRAVAGYPGAASSERPY